MDPTKEGSSPPPDPSGERARITAETVEQVRQERENAYISLMDEMEKSVGEKGQYFVEFGHKKDTSRGHDTDTRALLLIKSTVDPKDSSNLFIVITREGPKGLRLVPQDKNPQDQDEQAEEAMKRIIQGRLKKTEEGYSGYTYGYVERGYGLLPRDGKLLIKVSEDEFYFPSDTTEIRPVDAERVKIAIEESQRAAEIPHFVKLQQEQQWLADARSLMDVVNKLPPKQ